MKFDKDVKEKIGKIVKSIEMTKDLKGKDRIRKML